MNEFILILTLVLVSDQSYTSNSLANMHVMSERYRSEEACERAADAWREEHVYVNKWEVREEDKTLSYRAKCVPAPGMRVAPSTSIYLPREK